MQPLRLLPILVGASLISAVAADRPSLTTPMSYSGMADASGGVPIGSNLFIAANDEDNVLRLYRRDQGGPPLQEWNLDTFLQVADKSPEADLEGGAMIGHRAFWIGSHARNRLGKERSNRCRLFATDIVVTNGNVSLTPVGEPYKRLLDDLIADPHLARFNLAHAASLAPKDEDSLNIEGLAATSDGHLLIGFRSPLTSGKALIVPVLNPNEIVLGGGRRAKLGPPIQLDLGGLGIRDMSRVKDDYLILAGRADTGGKFRLYRWNGAGAKPERLDTPKLKEVHPEAVIIYPETGLREIQLLSDDGERLVDGTPGKRQPDPAKRTFRSVFLLSAGSDSH